jgi:SET domain-containing protein
VHLLDPYLEVKTSTLPDAGKGLFTKIFIPKGMLITEHVGKITSFKKADYEDNNPYVFYVTANHVIDAREQLDAAARFANDARGIKRIVGFTNNAKYIVIDKRVFITATKNIQPNEEIFVGYGKEYWDVMKQNYKLGF